MVRDNADGLASGMLSSIWMALGLVLTIGKERKGADGSLGGLSTCLLGDFVIVFFKRDRNVFVGHCYMQVAWSTFALI